jgi:3-keto-disaccharide hydrolase
MTRRLLALATVLAAIAVVGLAPRGHADDPAPAKGWVSLFDGESLANWNPIGTATWRLENGAVVADSGNGFLVSKEAYGDFQLRAEFWIDPETNSGIFIRCTDPTKVTGQTAYEVNIWDTRPDPSYGTGAIVDVAKVDPMPKAGGQWNVYEITAKGSQFTVVLNGQTTVNGAEDSKFARGHIALQHGLGVNKSDKGAVKFRKVEIRTP